MKNNPFDITKAVDYTDEEIYRYWVDPGEDNRGFESLIRPDTLMPMIIVGSKGSGKTHVMKYFSYELQKIRCSKQTESMQKELAKEKFIGVYIRCSGFNSDKFCGKGVNDDMWGMLHAYYWELWIGERLVDILMDLNSIGLLQDVNEAELVNSILSMFLKHKENINSFYDLNQYLLELQRNLDYQVQNFMFMGQKHPEVEILLPPTRLTYEIPSLLKSKVAFFKNKYILYLIDELENFSAEQQKLIQTLMREKPVSLTFRVGTRPYGIRTFQTLRGVEENRDGAEFQGVVLDEFLRKLDNYKSYVEDIINNRLRNSGLSIPGNFTISELFEIQTNEDVLKLVNSKKGKQGRQSMYNLERNLRKIGISEDAIHKIIDNIIFSDNILIERTNIMLMYSALKAAKGRYDNIVIESEKIKESAIKYVSGDNKDTLHYIKLEKFKQDLIDNLSREGRVDIPYYGLKKLIELSCGTPRTILCLLKAAFNNQYFNTGKVPFEEGRMLSIKSQKIGIESTYEWFFEENRIPSSTQSRATEAIERIGNYLRMLRFSDLPPQCSINIFTLNSSELSPEAKNVFDSLVSYSYIVQTDERRLINSDNRTHVYRLNSILSPKYELALSKRGNVNFSSEEAELFFNPKKRVEYEKYFEEKQKIYNFPFGKKEAPIQLKFNMFS